ncbi:alcohol dehydrogenase catalytic domain-containing protein, partial [Streptomyces sp. NPDC014734]|uniref:alcohol dehydrogenase catalytic domain-containing protein n=1 Tax=Streptomyces sp. NPDC014734 TaxID=3364886 RepID=UPI0036FD8D3B
MKTDRGGPVLRVRHEVDGGPEVLFVERVDVPEAGAGEVLIRVEAIGVTLPTVRKVREGSEPISFGGEVAGEIVALGAGVTAFAVGERVTGL